MRLTIPNICITDCPMHNRAGQCRSVPDIFSIVNLQSKHSYSLFSIHDILLFRNSMQCINYKLDII